MADTSIDSIYPNTPTPEGEEALKINALPADRRLDEIHNLLVKIRSMEVTVAVAKEQAKIGTTWLRQIERLTLFIRREYAYEINRGLHGDSDVFDIAIRYMAVERSRWRILLRNILRGIGSLGAR